MRFVLFVIAGSISVPFNVGTRLLLSRVVSFEVAVVGAHLAGMLVAYLAMKYLVFGRPGRAVGSDLGRFALVNGVSLAQTWLSSTALLALVPPSFGSQGHRESACHFVALSATALTSFLLHRSFSFRATSAVAQAATA